MSNDNPPQNPPVKSFLETIKEMYPDEFSHTPKTLKKQLKDMDEIIAIEDNYLDKPGLIPEIDEEIQDAVEESYESE
jgi:hypothetical protein